MFYLNREVIIMRIFASKWFILVPAVLLLIGCGGGGGGSTGGNANGVDSSMTLNVASLTTATTPNTYTGSLATTPVFFGEMVSQTTYTQAIVEMSGPNLQVSICANMSAGLGTYPINPGLMCTGVQYIVMSNGTGTQIYGASSGTITVTSAGSTGQPIVGTFDSIVTNLTDTKRVWGSFSINRVM